MDRNEKDENETWQEPCHPRVFVTLSNGELFEIGPKRKRIKPAGYFTEDSTRFDLVGDQHDA